MSLSPERKASLDSMSKKLRIEVLDALHHSQSGHPGGSLSVCEILTVIYFEKANVNPKNPKMETRDRVVLSKGHAAPMLYCVLAEMGFFPKEDLKTLRQYGSHLQGHVCASHTPGVDASTGPLGVGYPNALGMALGLKLSNIDSYVYAILGDGECDEGLIWEAAMSASKFKADNLITILDNNGVQLDGTCEEIMPLLDMKAKWKSFGYNVIECDGHDVSKLSDAIDEAKKAKGIPTIIIAHTVKGKGVSFMEGKNAWHGKAVSDKDFEAALAELGGII